MRRIPVALKIDPEAFPEDDVEARAAAQKMAGFTLEWEQVFYGNEVLDEEKYLSSQSRHKMLVADELLDGLVSAYEMRQIGWSFKLYDNVGNRVF